ncbi:MAG: hypothetical protein L6R42_005006, partial [Xanthoria sp. 1 TBL-2021]
LLGSPNFSDCRKLLFGDGDFRSPGRFGIAAIDQFSHAFTIPRAEREYESDSEWARRVPISKIWANSGCKIALLPKLLPIFDEVGQYSRDTGEWLPIAETAQYVNEFCVKDRGMGGLEEVGSTRRLLIVLYEPGSQQDHEIEEERRETGMATMRSIGIDFSAAWGNAAWGDAGGSDADSEASMEDKFAEFLNIDDGEPHSRARAGGAGAAAASHVGAADPYVRNLGDGWVLGYASVQIFKTVGQAAAGLITFYKDVIALAAVKIASGTPSAKSHGFRSHGLSLKLQSTDTISWEWIVRFAQAMSLAAEAKWPVLYQGVANSRYWDKASIKAVLVAIQ